MTTCSNGMCKHNTKNICKCEDIDLVMTYSDARIKFTTMQCRSFEPVNNINLVNKNS